MFWALIIWVSFGVLSTEVPSKHWVVSGQVYFRKYYLLLAILLALYIMIVRQGPWILDFVICLWLILLILLCLRDLMPFTVLHQVQIKNESDRSSKDHAFNILICNVYQDNKSYEEVIDLVREHDPDLLLFMEVNQDWYDHLVSLEQEYRYVTKEIRENTYGMVFISRLEPISSQVLHLQDDEIPSIEVKLNINRQVVHLLCLHPKPVAPQEADTSIPKERELLAAANYVMEWSKQEATIVLGDLNDVPWSNTSRRFKKKTKLKDVRIGRGFFNTFPTQYPIRFPIDQIYCTDHFRFRSFTKLPNIGSDHFPILVSLVPHPLDSSQSSRQKKAQS